MKIKFKIKNKFIKDNRGIGIEDAPFQILAAVLVLVVAVGIGMHIWINFNCGNQCQNAAESALDIQKYSNLLSAGSDGSQKIIYCKLPQGFVMTFTDGDIVLDGSDNECDCFGIKTLNVEDVEVTGVPLTSGQHKLKLEYKIEGGQSKVEVTKLN